MKAQGGGADREVKIVDMGRYNLGVAVLRRGALKPGATIGGINHTKVTEVYYVVSGEGTMVMGTDVKDVRPVGHRTMPVNDLLARTTAPISASMRSSTRARSAR